MNRILDKFTAGIVVLGLALAGCGGGSEPASDAQVTAAVRSSAKEMEPELERDEAVARFKNVLEQLRPLPELAPLFDLYQVPDPIVIGDDEQSAGLIELLHAVKITLAGGQLTMTNRETGGVIYAGPRSDLAAGTVYPENMPGGTPPPASACAYEYSEWAACQPDGTQSRTVVASSPEGCTGTPVLTQACTSTPPAPETCSSFTYSAWGACQPDSTQTRTVTSTSPAGCTGGSPATSQACTYTPPVTTCSSFTYSAWGACQPDSTQTRTVTSSSPAGCTGGSPTTTQACTYTPPVTTCSSFTYSAWGACQPDSTQTRTVTSSSPAGCTGGSPVTAQACTYVPPVTTCSSFTYSAWGACQPDNTQTRTVLSSSPAGCTGGSPTVSQACVYSPPPLDGAALYTASCSRCHGSLASSDLKGRGMTVQMIKDRRMTQGLNDAQLQAIVDVVGP